MKLNVADAIITQKSYGKLDENKTAQLDIAYGIDKNFQLGAGVSIVSVVMNNPDLNLHFHIFSDYEDEQYNKNLHKVAEDFSVKITIYKIDDNYFNFLPSTAAWSTATYYRFIAFEYLSTSTEKLLYLDADVMCKGSLKYLTELEFSTHEYAAVVKDVAEIRDVAGTRLGSLTLNGNYFNAGVMYVLLTKWRDNAFLDKALELLINKRDSLKFFDQDVLNLLLLGHTHFLSENFNRIYGIKNELKFKDMTKYKNIITESTVLIHYIGVTKPWNTWADYPSAQYFKKAYLASPWSGQPLIGPRTPKQFKKKFRHEKLQGKYLDAISSYCGYLLAKLKSK